MVDHQALFAKVVDAMRVAVAVVGLLLTFVADGDPLKDRLTAVLKRFQVFFLEPVAPQ